MRAIKFTVKAVAVVTGAYFLGAFLFLFFMGAVMKSMDA